LSLEENGSSGNPADLAPMITALDAPSAEIRLWWCRLDASPLQFARYEGLLSSPELARASRFGNPGLRNRYIAGRGALRTILGLVLGVDPPAVDIVRGGRGRPRLRDEQAIDFNISHTADVAVVGITETARVGVDIERTDRMINVAGIARKFLTERERSELPAQAPDAARRRVLALWTCKEAMSKATGDALSAPFGSIDVDADRRTLRSGPGVYAPDAWSLHAAAVPRGYVATIAVWRPRSRS
jgi:4'-phosphopantetheinyl transferase